MTHSLRLRGCLHAMILFPLSTNFAVLSGRPLVGVLSAALMQSAIHFNLFASFRSMHLVLPTDLVFI